MKPFGITFFEITFHCFDVIDRVGNGEKETNLMRNVMSHKLVEPIFVDI